MSFILDALKRAESERQRGQVPGLQAQPLVAGGSRAADPGSRLGWWLGATALVLAISAHGQPGTLSFADAAIRYSETPQALEGGDLGWRRYDQIPSAFTELVATMSKGDISQPVRGPNGFHLIHLADTRAESVVMVKEFHARHIVIKPSELLSEDKARERIDALRKRIVDGASFEDLARQADRPVDLGHAGEDRLTGEMALEMVQVGADPQLRRRALGLAHWRAKNSEAAHAAFTLAATDGRAEHLVAWCLSSRQLHGSVKGWSTWQGALERHPGMAALLDGLDEVGATLARGPEIAAFRARDRDRRPWAYAPGSA